MLLETPRLLLTPITPADRDFFFAVQQDSELMRFVSDPRSPADIAARFEAACQPWDKEQDQWLSLVVRDKASRQPFGINGFRSDWPNRQAELGFLFLTAGQGQGYALESTRAVLAFAVAQGYHKLCAQVTAGNLASSRLLEKCGFKREGELREHFWLGGCWHDDWLYGLLAREYPPEG
ncbi:GNAT family protein [Gallaecimonas kandeliae]|uniref:GNAT family N-acetyltransferase n=1 Tax=Gallaecimonas kandeliae TaxID=3029055 RepID=UPI00264980CC|nr:GNAT family protein [Gallaecimonas kandeliae]WKE64304.1 GNAT family protein [Gallaecimonas kandeliae]